MKTFRFMVLVWTLIGAAIFQVGCGPKKEASGGHEEESPSGASFKIGKGITLTNETRKILNIEIADISEEMLSQVIHLNIQVFSETHRFTNMDIDHTACDIHGSGFLPPEKTAIIEPKQLVQLTTANNDVLNGFVVAVQKTLTHGENEIIVGITSADAKVKDGEFVTATITIPRKNQVVVIPSSALLKTSTGTFVYAVNGAAYYRTAVKVGSASDDKIEIIDGLYAGDQVVTQPVETLWLIELRATKGGGHCH